MTPFAARCCTVGSAIALLAVGVAAPLAGAGRVVVIGAAAVCAVLDLLLVRAVRTSGGTSVVTPVSTPPGTPAGTSLCADRGRVDDDAPRTAPHGPDPTAGSAAPGGGAADDETPVVLGTAPDGSAVTLDAHVPVHVVVAGRGALALAVHRAVAAQVRTAAVVSGATFRIAAAPELRSVRTGDDEPCPTMPDGTAALVVDPGPGGCRASVVLVSDPGQWPRRWDVAVEVTRYGCSVRHRGEPRGRTVSPVLPTLAS